MASNFVFCFFFLFSYFLLLLSAAPESWDIKCAEEKASCGYLGEISYPFTTVDNTECGFHITGCEQNYSSVKTINLGNQTYIIDSINYMYNSFIIYGPSSSDSYLESIKNTPPLSINTITFYGCYHIPENMFKYRSCSDYDIYLTSKPLSFPISPCPCLPVQVVNELPHNLFHGCTELISLKEIKVDLESCERCYHTGMSCLTNQETLNFTCGPALTPQIPTRNERHLKNAVKGLSIGLATMITIALFVMILFLYYWRIKSLGVKNQLRTNNHGLSRNTTIPESGAVYFGIPVFSYEELKEATNNFDQARELGEGGFGTIYYGKLGDGREVAVKRLFERNYRPVESFTNEIQILTRMRHRNLVSLYGCTSRHSRELLLVYEYVPNGTVSSHLHDNKANQSSSLPWAVRMKIAIETASALTYLHASDVIHRDVKTTNILLDNSFCVKVADFGLSRLYPNDVTHVSTAPRGTPGYVDPEYRLCYQLTSKSDVYSFGVVLVELISSLPAVDVTRDRNDIKLANLAIRKIQKREICELIDPSLGFQTDEKLKVVITSVAELAFQCLQEEKELRPSMSEVLEVLQRIESGKDDVENHEAIDFHHGVGVAQSYAHPSLPNTWMKPQRHQRTL